MFDVSRTWGKTTLKRSKKKSSILNSLDHETKYIAEYIYASFPEFKDDNDFLLEYAYFRWVCENYSDLS